MLSFLITLCKLMMWFYPYQAQNLVLKVLKSENLASQGGGSAKKPRGFQRGGG